MPKGITFKHTGDFSKTEKFLLFLTKRNHLQVLNQYGQRGVEALAAATPKDTGLTASSWTYEIESNSKESSITFYNTNIQNGVNIAIILQHGHGTRNGGYVQGRDYINPAIQPIFDQIADQAWREVTEA